MYLLIAIVVTIYTVSIPIYFFYLKLTKNKRLEKLAEEDYDELLKKLKESVLFENDVKNLQRIRNMRDMFLRLKERRKHLPNKEKDFLYKDWLDYVSAWRHIESCSEIFSVDSKPDYDAYDDTVKELLTKIEEIERRFRKLLNKSS